MIKLKKKGLIKGLTMCTSVSTHNNLLKIDILSLKRHRKREFIFKKIIRIK